MLRVAAEPQRGLLQGLGQAARILRVCRVLLDAATVPRLVQQDPPRGSQDLLQEPRQAPQGGGGGAGPLGSRGKLLEILPLEIGELFFQEDDAQAGFLQILVQVLLGSQSVIQDRDLRSVFLLARPGSGLRLAQTLQLPLQRLQVLALLTQDPDLLLDRKSVV